MPAIDDGYQGCSGYVEIVTVSASLREAKGKPCVEVHVHDAAGSSTALYDDGAELRRMADDLKLAANELDRAQGKMLRIVEGRIAHIPEGWSVVDFLDGDGRALKVGDPWTASAEIRQPVAERKPQAILTRGQPGASGGEHPVATPR
jgi:hypothetical protein